ncbi:MAG: anti-sigma regulatory factor [Ruminococcaceae bacterium]|nr:anti-sigma regulatory factor [Oscillospiraceae bacterium]
MMESIKLHYTVPGDDFTRAGAASGDVKRTLKELGVSPSVIRNVSIAMYEGEINMVIHANGGVIDVEITEEDIIMTLKDEGPGIENVELAMKEGYSTAPDNIRTLGFGAGMGLPNIKKYTDEFSIDTEVGVGTTLNLKVKIQ